MNYPTFEDIKTETNKICNLILTKPKEIEYRCKDGYVCVNPDNLNFTYAGVFGSMVLNTAIKAKANMEDDKRLMNLATCILIYSMNVSGFNIITKN